MKWRAESPLFSLLRICVTSVLPNQAADDAASLLVQICFFFSLLLLDVHFTRNHLAHHFKIRVHGPDGVLESRRLRALHRKVTHPADGRAHRDAHGSTDGVDTCCAGHHAHSADHRTDQMRATRPLLRVFREIVHVELPPVGRGNVKLSADVDHFLFPSSFLFICPWVRRGRNRELFFSWCICSEKEKNTY